MNGRKSWWKWMTGVAGIVLFIFMISVVSAQAQYVSGGIKTFGGSGDEFTTVAVDGSGNIYMAGGFSGTVNFNPWGAAVNRTSNGSVDAFVSKFDKKGNFLWVRTWGGAGIDACVGVSTDSSGNVYLSGKFQQTVDFMPGTSGFSRTSNGMNDIFLVKYDPNGILKWLRTWGGASGDDGYLCAVDSAGNVYVVGDFSSNFVNFNTTGGSDIHNRKGPAGSFDAYISKHDTNGNFQWARTWGGGWYTDGPSVAVDGSGNVYVAGMFENTVNFNPGPGVENHTAHGGAGCTNPGNCPIDVFLSKFDANGNFKWAKTWGGNGSDCGSVNVDTVGNIYVSGYFNGAVDFNPWGAADIHTSKSASDTFLSKFDPSGNFQWARTFGGNSSYGGGTTAFDGAGNIYIAGPFIGSANFNPNGSDIRTSKGGKDVFFTKFDPSGNYQWTKTWGGTGDDGGYGIAIDRGLGTIYVAGVFSNTVDFNPWGVADNKTSNGGADVFLSKFKIQYSTQDTSANLVWASGGTTGKASVWKMNASGVYQSTQNYQAAGWLANSYQRNVDGTANLSWTQNSAGIGKMNVWLLDVNGVYKSTQSYQTEGWEGHNYYRNNDGTGYVLWTKSKTATASVWKVNASGVYQSAWGYQGPTGMIASSFIAGKNGLNYLLWTNPTNGTAALWTINASGVYQSAINYQQTGWLAMSLHRNPDGTFYLLWSQPGTAKANVWKLNSSGVKQSAWDYQQSGMMARGVAGPIE
jgi:hypothetical protein